MQAPPPKIVNRILLMIAKWEASFASQSKYRRDFFNIKAMHRLLLLKGYQFPRIMPVDIAALVADEVKGLKSKAEMEQEMKSVYGAVNCC
jgi:hypothetical protein